MEKQLTKEQIWEAENNNDQSWTDSAMSAMDIWGKQTAIAFAKWITDMGINYWDKDKWEAWEHNSLSSEQLYELYTQSLNQQ